MQQRLLNFHSVLLLRAFVSAKACCFCCIQTALLAQCPQRLQPGIGTRVCHMLQVQIPDTAPPDMLQREGCLSMVAGDFVEVYSSPGQKDAFDAVATCFFLDTAHNIFEYMDVIYHTLKASVAAPSFHQDLHVACLTGLLLACHKADEQLTGDVAATKAACVCARTEWICRMSFMLSLRMPSDRGGL